MISIKALLTMEGKGSDKLAKETKAIRDNLDNSADQAARLDARLGKAGTTAAKKAGAFNDRDGISAKENRGAKGVSGQRGAAGRDMAGLRDASDSTSGIVAAYATAAANMFAITAAFKALSDAAKVQQLREGLELVGAQSGVTLGLVSKNLEKVTGYGISAAEAMKSVASATAAGFSGIEIERLGKVARGAAVALGRDMSDAMDRLTRGSIKLEPELLDELGIMTRIDDAVRLYADAHDKAKSSLTQTERRQAFLNAVLEEGESKFGSIADSVPISAFDKLNASMKNMATGGIGEIVKFLTPLVELLTAMPALIMLPMAGLLTSISNKLIPGASAQLEKFERKAIAAGRAVQNSTKYKNFRVDQLDDSIEQARKRSMGGKLNIDVPDTDNKKIGTLKAERALVIDILAKQKELLRTALQQGDVAKAKLATETMAAGKASVAAYTQSIALTERNWRGDNAVAKKGFKFNMQDLSAKAYERTQIELASREGDTKGQAIAGLKGVRAQFASIIPTVLTYRTALMAANIESGKGGPIITGLKTAWAAASASAFAFGVTAKLAIQGLVASIPIIGWIITGVTLLFAAWDMFKSEKDKSMEELRTQAKEILKTTEKVNEEIVKFREKGQFGRAFEAEIGNLSEVYNKLKEIINLRDAPAKKVTEDSRARKYDVKNLVGKDDEKKGLLNTTLDRIETFKGKAYVQSLLKEMIKVRDAGGDWVAVMQPAVDGADSIAKSWTDIGEAVKTGGQAIRKFWGDDFFKTDYTEIAGTFKTITTELEAQNKYITDPISKVQAASDVMSKFVAGGQDMFLEMDRVMGTGATTFVDYYKELSVKQTAINTLNAAGDEASVARAKQMTAELTTQQALIQEKIRASGVLEKIALEEFRVKLATIRVESAKGALALQELKNAARLANNSIAASEQAMDRMQLAQGFDILQGYDKVDAIKQAEVELKNAQDVSSLKNAVLDREFELAALQKSLMQTKARLELIDAESQFKQKYYNKDGSLNMGAMTYDKGGGLASNWDADRKALDLRAKIVGLLGEIDSTGESINTAQKDANDREIRVKAQALALAKQTFKDSISNLKQELDIATAKLELELKIAQIRRDSSDAQADLQRTIELNNATRTNFGGLDELGTLSQAKAKALQDKLAASEREAARVKSENNAIKTLQQAEAQARGLKFFAGNNPELAATAQKNLTAASTAVTTALDTQKTSGLAAADAIAVFAEVIRNLTNQFEDIEDLPGQINKQREAAVQARTRAGASVGMNLAGAGAEFQAGLDKRWGEVGQSVYGGDYNKFIQLEDITLIKKAALELKELSIVTEGITNVSMAFNDQLAGAFSSIIDGSKDAKEAFADLAISMLKMIGDIIAQLLAMQAVKMIGSAFGIPITGAAGGTMSKGLADGGIMSRAGGGLQGVVNKPTYLVGEGRYNEAVVPLPNGRAIPVQMHGNNTSSNSVQVNVNMSSNGEAKTNTQGPDMNNLGAAIAAAVQKELHVQKAPGGILSRYGVA